MDRAGNADASRAENGKLAPSASLRNPGSRNGVGLTTQRDSTTIVRPAQSTDDFGALVCFNCQAPVEALVWVEGFNFWGCWSCAQEAALVDEAEGLCPEAYRLVIKATGLREMRRAFRAHVARCVECGGARRRPVGSEGGERKVKVA